MKIIHLSKVTGIAGSEGHLLQLLPRLRARGIDARMLVLGQTAASAGGFIEALQALGVPTELAPMSWHLDPGLPARLRAVFRAEQPDFVHTHLIHADLYGIPAARAAGVPHVVSSRHNTDRFRAWPVFQAVNRMLWSRTDRGIAISEAVRAFVLRYEGARPDQVQTIYYGYEPPSDDGQAAARRAALRAEWGIPPDAVVAGSICRLIAQKGLDTALEAFAAATRSHPGAHYVLAGDGKLRPALEAQAKALGLGECVHFLGWRSDAHAVYDALDLFLSPSRWEGFGLVLLEAMSHRLPIIGSTAGAIPEVVADGETGFLPPPGDPAALAAPLEALLADPALRRRMGEAGKTRLETVFSVGKMVDETVAFYEEVARP